MTSVFPSPFSGPPPLASLNRAHTVGAAPPDRQMSKTPLHLEGERPRKALQRTWQAVIQAGPQNASWPSPRGGGMWIFAACNPLDKRPLPPYRSASWEGGQ